MVHSLASHGDADFDRVPGLTRFAQPEKGPLGDVARGDRDQIHATVVMSDAWPVWPPSIAWRIAKRLASEAVGAVNGGGLKWEA